MNEHSEQDRPASSFNINRRNLLGLAGGAAAALALGHKANAQGTAAQGTAAQPTTSPASATKAVSNGRINQSVCQWCFNRMPVEKLAEEGARIGLKGIDLVGPDAWPAMKKHGIIGTMTPSHGLTKGLNHKENHEECLGAIRRAIEATSEAGFPNVICFSGNRNGMSDEEGLQNCAIALKQVVGLAEQRNVTICMELLNSKVNHADYMCDRTAWGVNLVKAVGSERFKLLYDIYHMQVQEGDVIATIRNSKDYIGHYHTAGVPGRNEIDPESQELSYAPIMRAIVDTGFKGYVAHEFIPRRDPITSLAQAARISDV
ncbi:MAG TPA: TIM barrel protein [Abditibacteriaceae bacterium]|jgi:hydroxypyruvate isomerase